MGVLRRLVEEQVLHDHALHRPQAGRDVTRVGVGLGDVLALHVEALERAAGGLVEHVVDAHAGIAVEAAPPHLLVDLAGIVVVDVAVAGVLVRE